MQNVASSEMKAIAQTNLDQDAAAANAKQNNFETDAAENNDA